MVHRRGFQGRDSGIYGSSRTAEGLGPWYRMTPVQEATKIQHWFWTSTRSIPERRGPGCNEETPNLSK